jgi:hypothetical protein
MSARSSSSSGSKKRPAPLEEVPDGAAFNLGDIEAEYGKATTKFKAPRYRKPKEVTNAAKNIGSVQYEQMYDQATWFTGVIPFLASPKKLPAPRSNKIATRTVEGVEADKVALGIAQRTDSQRMPPPAAAPIKRFTPQELRRVDLSSCMNRIYETEGDEYTLPVTHQVDSPPPSTPAAADAAVSAEGVSTTYITTNSTTVTRQAARTTITSEQVRSARSSIPSYMPSPLRSDLDGSYLQALPIDDLRLASSFVPYSPLHSHLMASPARRESSMYLSDLAEISSAAVLQEESPASQYQARQTLSSYLLPTPQPSPRRTPAPSPFRSPSRPDLSAGGDCSDLVDQLPRLTPLLRSSPAYTPGRFTPNEYANHQNNNTSKPSSQDCSDLLIAHFNAEWASESSK